MNTNEETTVLKNNQENIANDANNANNANNGAVEETPKKKSYGWVPVTLAGVGGLVFGTASTFIASDMIDNSDEVMPEGKNPDIVVPEGIQTSDAVNDDMSFSDAFAAAREDVGSGGVFFWRGNLYNTFTREEWDAMSDEDKNDFGRDISVAHDNREDQGANQDTDGENVPVADVQQPDEKPTEENSNAESESSDTESENDPLLEPEPSDILDVEEHDVEAEVVEDGEALVEEVQVISLEHDVDLGDGAVADSVGTMSVNGESVYLVDTDSDGNFDSTIDGNEIQDIPDGMESVDSFEQELALQSAQDDLLNPADDGMPDYINDADVSDFA